MYQNGAHKIGTYQHHQVPVNGESAQRYAKQGKAQVEAQDSTTWMIVGGCERFMKLIAAILITIFLGMISVQVPDLLTKANALSGDIVHATFTADCNKVLWGDLYSTTSTLPTADATTLRTAIADIHPTGQLCTSCKSGYEAHFVSINALCTSLTPTEKLNADYTSLCDPSLTWSDGTSISTSTGKKYSAMMCVSAAKAPAMAMAYATDLVGVAEKAKCPKLTATATSAAKATGSALQTQVCTAYEKIYVMVEATLKTALGATGPVGSCASSGATSTAKITQHRSCPCTSGTTMSSVCVLPSNDACVAPTTTCTALMASTGAP